MILKCLADGLALTFGNFFFLKNWSDFDLFRFNGNLVFRIADNFICCDYTIYVIIEIMYYNCTFCL